MGIYSWLSRVAFLIFGSRVSSLLLQLRLAVCLFLSAASPELLAVQQRAVVLLNSIGSPLCSLKVDKAKTLRLAVLVLYQRQVFLSDCKQCIYSLDLPDCLSWLIKQSI